MMLRRSAALLLPLAICLSAPTASAFFADGEGYYALRGETRTSEAFAKNTGTFQAIEQSFRLLGEARFNDQSSLFLEFHLFDDPRKAYLGDKSEPADCPPDPKQPSTDPDHPCKGRHQNTGEPRYQPYTPRVTKAYVRYAFDYCIVEAGRRPRQWGLGMFMDAGNKPFDTDASVYDGVTCNVNIQKTQTLGFSIGYDKLAETGSYVFIDESQAVHDRKFGANDTNDDLDQYFFTIEYDDRKANAGAAFTKQVGVYFAQVSSRALKDGGANTDLKFLDLYTGFYFTDLALRNEILFRMGKSADPNWQLMGGAQYDDGLAATNKLNSIGFAGNLNWTVSRSGAAIGPAEYNKGDATGHVLFLDWAYAPGDEDGWRSEDDNPKFNSTAIDKTYKYRRADRDTNVTGMAFHRNFKPALILFNGRPESDHLNVDGAFNPSRVENATVFGTGYRYESMQAGNFEAKFVTASLNKSMPSDIKEYYGKIGQCAPGEHQTTYNAGTAAEPKNQNVKCDDGDRPAGFFGNSLGYELDLTYAYKVGREAEFGGAMAAALPGKAWRTSVASKPVNDFLIQSFVAFHF